MLDIIEFTYQMKYKLFTKVNNEINSNNLNLQFIPHYKLLKRLKPFSKKNNQSNKIFEKLKKENKIVEFTLKLLKERGRIDD